MTMLRCSRVGARGYALMGWARSSEIGWERFSRSGVALSVVGHVALLLGLTYIGAGAVKPIAPEAIIVETVPPIEAPASPAPPHRQMHVDGSLLGSPSTRS